MTLTERFSRIREDQADEAVGPGTLDLVRAVLEPIGRIAEEAIDLPGELLAWLEGGGGR